MKEQSLNKRYSAKLLSSLISGIINIFFIVIIPKALGPSAFGQFVYIQQFFLKAIGFLDACSSIAFFTKLSAKQERKELISFYFYYSILVYFISFVFLFVFDQFDYYYFLFPDIEREYIYLGLVFGFLSWFSQITIKISDAYALTITVELVKIINKFFSLCFLLYFIYYFNFDLEGLFLFHIISLFVFVKCLLYLFKRKGIISVNIMSFGFLKFKVIFKEFLDYCLPLFAYSFVVLSVGLFDIWLLQNLNGSVETAYYGLSFSVAAMCFIFTGAMTPIITREFSKNFEKKDLESMRNLFKRYIPMLYSLASFFSIFLVFQSENFLNIFFDKEFEDAFLVLSIMAFYPIHQTYGQLSGSIFYSTNQTKLYRNIGLISVLLGLLLSLIFVYALNLKAEGLALKMVLTQIIAVNIQLFFNVKLLNLKMNKFIWHQLVVIVLLSLVAFLSKISITFNSPLISFVSSGFVYTFIVIMLFIFFPELLSVKKNELLQVLKKVRKKLFV